MTYRRPPGAVYKDFETAREFEEFVAQGIPVPVHTRFAGKDDLDIWVPGFYLEVKEKRQSFTDRWHLLDGTPESDLFILDEQSVRRGLRHWPHVYFLLRDVPGGRMFVAPIWELAACRRHRVNREKKGKWIIDLTEFREIFAIQEIYDIAMHELPLMPWAGSECVGRDVNQV